MTIPIERLEVRLGRAATNVERAIQGVVQIVFEEVGSQVVRRTPVDTGFARANWRPTRNSPSTRPVTALDPTGSATIARIAAVARSYRLGDTLYNVNRAPYIGLLNQGRSPQAPAGFVGSAVSSGTALAVTRFNAILSRICR